MDLDPHRHGGRVRSLTQRCDGRALMRRILLIMLAFLVIAAAGVYAIFAHDLAGAAPALSAAARGSTRPSARWNTP